MVDCIQDGIDNFNILGLVKENCYDLLQLVLENLDIYNFPFDSQDENGDTLLHQVTRKEKYRFVEKLINFGCNVNIANNDNETALHLACSTGNLKLVQLLIENEGRVDVLDKKGETPIFKAVRNGHLHVVQHLQSKYEFWRDINHENRNLLHVGVASGSVIIAEHLIKTGSFAINSPIPDGSSALHLALELPTNIGMLKLLLSNGGDLHVKDAKSRSLLHLTVTKSSLELCKFLIDCGIDVNGQDDNGSTALHYAIEQQLKKIAFLLVHNGADLNKPDSDGYTPLHVASKGDCNLVKFLLRNKAINNVKTHNGDLPLHLAASAGNFGAAVVLLDGGFRANDLNKDNYSPVQLAEINGHGKVQKLLTEHFANFGQSKIPRAVRRVKLFDVSMSPIRLM